MTHHGIARKAVSPSYKPSNNWTSDSAPPRPEHGITESEDTVSPLDSEPTVPFSSGQDERLDATDDQKQRLKPVQPDLSSAFAYDRAMNDQTAFESKAHGGEEGAERQPYQPSRGFLFHLKSWWPEIAYSLSSFALLIALIVLLRHYDGKPGPDYLNTVVAIIATTCRALTVVPIAEGLSQLKWNSFARAERPLTDLYIFDQASRGPFGSLMLLLRARGRLLSASTIAAVILVSGLATSSLTQATISIQPTPEKLVKDAAARKGLHHYYMAEALEEVAYSTMMMQEADRRDLLYQQVDLRCPVGDCRWEPFYSLGVCADIKNITDELEVTQLDQDVAKDMEELEEWRQYDEDLVLFNNVTSAAEGRAPCTVIDATAEVMGLLAACTGNELIITGPSFEPRDVVISEHYFIYKTIDPDGNSTFGTDPLYHGTQVTFHSCVHQYEVGVSAGVPHTRLLKETLKLNESNALFLEADNGEGFEYFTGSPLLMLHGNWSRVAQGNDVLLKTLERKVFWKYDDEAAFGPPANQFKLLESLVNDMALAMTNFLRVNNDDEKALVEGYASVGLIVVVHWPWLSLLAIQVVFTSGFLVYIVVDTARTGVSVVKSSALAELMAMPSTTGRAPFDDSETDSGGPVGGGIVAKVDPNLRGRLVREGPAWQLETSRQEPSGEKGPWLLRWLS